ncbi:MAG: hypothetical protein WEB89_01750 [Balneolales bacterium]
MACFNPVITRCFSGATPGIPGVAPEKQRVNSGETQSQNRRDSMEVRRNRDYFSVVFKLFDKTLFLAINIRF